MKLMILLDLLIVAAAEDILSGRVSNRLIATGLLAGSIFQIMEHQVKGIYYFLGNISIPIILFYLLFQMRVLGAGDIKLFSMTGSFLTTGELFQCITQSFFIAGAGAVLFLAADKKRWQRLKYAGKYLLDFMHTGKIKPYLPPDSSEQYMFAFSVSVLFGTVLALFPVR